MIKLTVAFRLFANAPETKKVEFSSSVYVSFTEVTIKWSDAPSEAGDPKVLKTCSSSVLKSVNVRTYFVPAYTLAGLNETQVFLDITPCRLVNNHRSFEEAKCLHLHGH
jgi:hypothetical protein